MNLEMCFAKLKRRENKNLADSNQVKKIKKSKQTPRRTKGQEQSL